VKVSQGKRSRRTLTAAACLLGGLLALPASASAGTKSQSTTLAGDGSVAALSAKCPEGQRASGGGFLASPPDASSLVRIYESRKSGQRSWRVLAELNGDGPLNLTAFAYCSADAPKTKERSTTIALTPSTTTIQTADAGCGGAGKAMAGGFSTTVSALIFDSLRADKKTWRSRARVLEGSPPLTSYAYCADEPKPAARTGSTSSSTSGTLHTALSAECKKGTKVVAGGFSQPTAQIVPTPNGIFSFFYESVKIGKRWRVSATHIGIASTTLNSIAYCG
jgi:hypothetical protein